MARCSYVFDCTCVSDTVTFACSHNDTTLALVQHAQAAAPRCALALHAVGACVPRSAHLRAGAHRTCRVCPARTRLANLARLSTSAPFLRAQSEPAASLASAVGGPRKCRMRTALRCAQGRASDTCPSRVQQTRFSCAATTARFAQQVQGEVAPALRLVTRKIQRLRRRSVQRMWTPRLGSLHRKASEAKLHGVWRLTLAHTRARARAPRSHLSSHLA